MIDPAFALHWGNNANSAAAFDLWFLNLFPRAALFTGNPGGYCTLNFIPTLATMILGLFAGDVLRGPRTPKQKLAWIAAAGAIGLVLGLIFDKTGICSSVKRIWTPSWVLFSGGWCFILMGAFYLVIDLWNRRAWAFPLVVIGMNSIAAYMTAHLMPDFIKATLQTHLGFVLSRAASSPYQPVILGLAVLAAEWMILLWMYRRKLFLKI
jgi:predicted acyltransferase